MSAENMHFLKKILLIFSVGVLLVLAYFSRNILVSASFGIMMGVVFSPFVEKISEKTKLNKAMSGAIFYIFISLSISLLLYLCVWIASDQVSQFLSNFSKMVSDARSSVLKTLHEYPVFSHFVESGKDPVVASEKVGEGILGGLNLGLQSFTSIALIVFVSFYIAIEPKYYFDFFMRTLPSSKQDYFRDKLYISARAIRDWFQVQMFDLLIVGFLTGFGLWVVGFKYWFVMGLVTGALCFIPYLGIWFSLLMSLVICLGVHPELWASVLLVYMVSQFIEGNILLPFLMRKKLELPEVPLLVIVLLMGVGFGPLGAVIAAPLLSIWLYWAKGKEEHHHTSASCSILNYEAPDLFKKSKSFQIDNRL